MNAKKVYVFGASVGGEKYFSQVGNDVNILGFLDNDKNKQGKLLHGIEIFSPEILKGMNQDEFDSIIITSMYIESIIKQLEELGIRKEKLYFPPKSFLKRDIKPFENPEMRRKATDLLCKLNNILKDELCYISFGTLLGIVRENSLLTWDDDIDISIFPKDVDIILELILSNIDKLSNDFKFKIYKREYSESKIANISMHCFHEGEDLFHISFACLNEDDGSPDLYYQEVNVTPKRFFDGYDELYFNQHIFKAPKEYEKYLEYTYGNWKVPRKNTSFYDNSLSYKESGRIQKVTIFYDFQSPTLV